MLPELCRTVTKGTACRVHQRRRAQVALYKRRPLLPGYRPAPSPVASLALLPIPSPSSQRPPSSLSTPRHLPAPVPEAVRLQKPITSSVVATRARYLATSASRPRADFTAFPPTHPNRQTNPSRMVTTNNVHMPSFPPQPNRYIRQPSQNNDETY